MSKKTKSVDIYDEFKTIGAKSSFQKDDIKNIDIKRPKVLENDKIKTTPETQVENNEFKWIGICVG